MSGFKLYEINQQMEDLLDEILKYAEDNLGEIEDEKLTALHEIKAERNVKILDLAKYIKTLEAKADAIYNEEQKLRKRFIMYSRYAVKLRNILSSTLNEGEKIEDNTTRIFWRKSDRVEIEDEEKIPDEYFVYDKAPSLQSIKKAIKQGVEVPGVKLTYYQNLQIN